MENICGKFYLILLHCQGKLSKGQGILFAESCIHETCFELIIFDKLLNSQYC